MNAAANPPDPLNTRRWPRHQVELPILIATGEDYDRTVVPGLATEISRRGMAFYAGAPLQAGDMMEVEFQTPHHVRLKGVVRSRAGYCFGVEFLNHLNGTSAHGAAPQVNTPQAGAEAWPGVPTAIEQHSTFAPHKRNASYADVCAELARAEDRLAARLQQCLDANVDQNSTQFKRLCLNLLKVRELRQKIEALVKAN